MALLLGRRRRLVHALVGQWRRVQLWFRRVVVEGRLQGQWLVAAAGGAVLPPELPASILHALLLRDLFVDILTIVTCNQSNETV